MCFQIVHSLDCTPRLCDFQPDLEQASSVHSLRYEMICCYSLLLFQIKRFGYFTTYADLSK